MTAHEEYFRKQRFTYDPADDGPEVDILSFFRVHSGGTENGFDCGICSRRRVQRWRLDGQVV
jgi:hypothetical protein